MNDLTFKRIPAKELRQIFNEGNYWEMAQRGEFVQKLTREGHPSPTASAEPICTRSQSITYFDFEGNVIAKVHQYLREDGSIGASGKPDPKRLRIGDTVYIVKKGETT